MGVIRASQTCRWMWKHRFQEKNKTKHKKHLQRIWNYTLKCEVLGLCCVTAENPIYVDLLHPILCLVFCEVFSIVAENSSDSSPRKFLHQENVFKLANILIVLKASVRMLNYNPTRNILQRMYNFPENWIWVFRKTCCIWLWMDQTLLYMHL